MHLSETILPRALLFGMKYYLVNSYQVCSDHAPVAKNVTALGLHVLHRLNDGGSDLRIYDDSDVKLKIGGLVPAPYL